MGCSGLHPSCNLPSTRRRESASSSQSTVAILSCPDETLCHVPEQDPQSQGPLQANRKPSVCQTNLVAHQIDGVSVGGAIPPEKSSRR